MEITKYTDKYASFTGEMKVLSERNGLLYDVEVRLLNDKTNRNNWRYTDMEAARGMFVNTPILVAYVNGKIGDGHNYREKLDAEGNEYASFTDATAERIVGWFKDDADIRVEEIDGAQWIIGKGQIWAYYASELTDLLSKQGERGMDVSIETLVEEGYMEGDTEVYTKYIILGTTILGEGIMPAVAGAYIRKLSISDEMEKFKLKVASLEKQFEHEPQKDNETERKKPTMSKTMMAEMQKRFDSHTVIAVSEDGTRVCLMDNNTGALRGYAFSSKEDMASVIPERIEDVRMTANAVFANSFELPVDIGEITDSLNAQLVIARANADKAEAALNEANEKLEKMEKAENARRVKAAKAAVKAKLAEINANRDNDAQMAESMCDPILSAIDAGEYTECINAEGEWCGDEKAVECLLAKCMSVQIDREKQNAAAKKTDYVWNRIGGGEPTNDDDSIEGLLARMSE